MSAYYHFSKTNILGDALSRLYLSCLKDVEEEGIKLVKDIHRLARLGDFLMGISYGGGIVKNGSKSSIVAEVKEKKDSDPLLLELKGAVNQKRVGVFSQGEDVCFAIRVGYVFMCLES